MTRPHLIRTGACTLALALCAVTIGACTPQEESPMSAAYPTTITVTQDEEIPMTSTIPEGWQVLTDKAHTLSYEVSSHPEDSLYHNAVNAQRYDARALKAALWIYEKPPTVDVAEWARSDRIGSENFEGYSHVEDLPVRLIGGAPAYGHTFIDSTKDSPVRRWEWRVGRPDGVWHILATSTSTSPDMPEDVALVINTITWETPTTTPQSTHQSSPPAH